MVDIVTWQNLDLTSEQCSISPVRKTKGSWNLCPFHLPSHWPPYLWAGWQVVVDCEGNFRLFPSDQTVGQSEVDKEVLEGAELGPPCQAESLLLWQTNSFCHPRGDWIWHIQLQLGLPGFWAAGWRFHDLIWVTKVIADLSEKINPFQNLDSWQHHPHQRNYSKHSEMDRCEVQSGVDPICFVDLNELRSLLA